jgi:PKD repeat protein
MQNQTNNVMNAMKRSLALRFKQPVKFLITGILMIIIGRSGCYADVLLSQHVIRQNAGGACSITAADFDQDGDPDIAYTTSTAGTLVWLENNGHQVFTEHIIAPAFTGARALFGIDMDHDGDTDLVATAFALNKFSWFENNGHGSFTEHVVSNTWTGASWVVADDLDHDGDVDIVGVACDQNRIGWFENDGNQQFTEHVLKSNWTKVNGATVSDLDKDGDMDIIATAKAGNIIWFVNNGNQQFAEYEICANWGAPNSVRAGDLDNDGDIDLVATSCGNGDKIAWFEHVENNRFNRFDLKNKYDGARQCEVSDIDQDGDLDILSIAWTTGVVTLFENKGKYDFREYQFCDDAYDMLKLFPVDLDRDGDLDIVGACFGTNQLRWWENINEFMITDFKVSTRSGHAPVEIEFTDYSSSRPAIVSRKWDFDGDSLFDSEEQNPTWIYYEPGEYTVTLNIANSLSNQNETRTGFIRVFDGHSALEFQGSGSFLEATPYDTLSLAEGFAFECWCKPFSFGENGAAHLFQKDKIKIFVYQSGALMPNSNCLCIFMTHQDGTISKACTPSNSILTEVWQHVAVSYNSGESDLKVFLDGVQQVLIKTVAPNGPLDDPGANPIRIGNVDRTNRAFNGIIDEVRVWNCPRSLSNVLAGMNTTLIGNETGLTGYWRLDEGSGDEAGDLTAKNEARIVKTLWAQGKTFASSGIASGYHKSSFEVFSYPNPFNDHVSLAISGDVMGSFQGCILDLSGRIIYIFPEINSRSNDSFVIEWSGENTEGQSVSPGIYVGVFTNGLENRKLKLIKM